MPKKGCLVTVKMKGRSKGFSNAFSRVPEVFQVFSGGVQGGFRGLHVRSRELRERPLFLTETLSESSKKSLKSLNTLMIHIHRKLPGTPGNHSKTDK